MTPTDLSSLRAKAEAATPGEWMIHSYEGPGRGVKPWHRYSLCKENTDRTEHECLALIYSPTDTAPGPNADFVEAANPETVLWLLDRIEELEREVEIGAMAKALASEVWNDGWVHGQMRRSADANPYRKQEA